MAQRIMSNGCFLAKRWHLEPVSSWTLGAPAWGRALASNPPLLELGLVGVDCGEMAWQQLGASMAQGYHVHWLVSGKRWFLEPESSWTLGAPAWGQALVSNPPLLKLGLANAGFDCGERAWQQFPPIMVLG